MVFHSCISGMYHKSVRVAAGSTDLGSVMSVFKLLLRLSYWLLLNWGGGGNKRYIAHVPFLVRKSLDFKFSLEIM